jgi:hypothetical protein
MRAPPSTSSPRRSSRIQKLAQKVAPPTSKKKTTRTSKPRPKKAKPPPTTKVPRTPLLYLRINRQFLLLLPAPTANQPNPQPLAPLPGTTGNLNVIIATLSDLNPFAGDTVDWLIKVARLIFEPLGTSSLYTFTTGSLESWLDRDMCATWRTVQDGEQLRATVYEFRPDNNTPIALTKVSLRHMRSVTTNTSAPRATTFRDTLLRRHQRCVISQQSLNLQIIASHLMPRRLGDVGVQSAFQRFTGSTATVDRYDPLLGVPLFSALDSLVDSYGLGFWNHGPVSLLTIHTLSVDFVPIWQNQYAVHSFLDTNLNLLGSQPLTPNDPMLHGHQVTLITHDPSLSLPPAGVFNWHYVQCVLTKFATDAYKAVDNVHYFSLPFRTRDDDDDDSDIDFDDERNVANPPYPSYLWELAESRARQHLEAVELNRAILTWESSVSVG